MTELKFVKYASIYLDTASIGDSKDGAVCATASSSAKESCIPAISLEEQRKRKIWRGKSSISFANQASEQGALKYHYCCF